MNWKQPHLLLITVSSIVNINKLYFYFLLIIEAEYLLKIVVAYPTLGQLLRKVLRTLKVVGFPPTPEQKGILQQIPSCIIPCRPGEAKRYRYS
ncbi:hypothetical protein SOPP22_14505 [Shewanella sp. OPT22]|nr:hypothetical protein SOPP22_14505 [Shewanella sp. OPT22]